MNQNSSKPNTNTNYNDDGVSASAPPVNYEQVPVIPPYYHHTPLIPIQQQFNPNYHHTPPPPQPIPIPIHHQPYFNNYDYAPPPNTHPTPNYEYAPDPNNSFPPSGTANYDYAPGSGNQSFGNYDYATDSKNSLARSGTGNYDYATGSRSSLSRTASGNYDYAPGSGNYDYATNQKPIHDSSSYSGYGNNTNNNSNNNNNDMYGDGVYAYSGVGKKEPYGARGSGNISNYGNDCSGKVVFDDYGRPIGNNNNNNNRVVKAGVLKDEGDMAGGVQKVRAKMLSEGVGQTDIDVLCQIGLDGIRILDPATSRTLRIYPLEAVTRWEVLDSYIFAFWAKTSSDMEPKRIRLKSNSYTCNNMLDTVTAASFQIKEIGETKKPSNDAKVSEQASEKKKGFPDWINLMKPRNEEKDYWVPDEAVNKCTACGTDFNAFVRRHHCRNCGDIFCDKCTQGRIALTADENDAPVRVCDRCMAEVTQRLTNLKEGAGKVATLQSHADLAKKLKEEMDKNRKPSTGLSSSGSGMRMKEVACPTCTVHLQVQAPSSGSETIECSVCQHPFLVHA